MSHFFYIMTGYIIAFLSLAGLVAFSLYDLSRIHIKYQERLKRKK